MIDPVTTRADLIEGLANIAAMWEREREGPDEQFATWERDRRARPDREMPVVRGVAVLAPPATGRPGYPVARRRWRVAALSPAMPELAGEIGDCVMLWLCNASYVRDVVVPAARAGRERGRGRKLLTDFSLPFYQTMLERSGCGEAGVTLPCVGPIPETDVEATLHAAAP